MKPIIKWQTHTTEATAKVLGVELSVKSNGKSKFESTVYCSGMRPEKDHTFDTLDDGKAWCEQTLQRWINASFETVSEPLSETLIEKLEQVISEHNAEFNKIIMDATNHQKIAHTAVLAGLLLAIKVAKQHQSWHKMPSDEKPQDAQVCNLLVKNESEESPTLYDIGLYREYKGEDVWLCMTRPEEHIDPSKILAWQPMNEPSNDFFESLEQPPSEVRDD